MNGGPTGTAEAAEAEQVDCGLGPGGSRGSAEVGVLEVRRGSLKRNAARAVLTGGAEGCLNGLFKFAGIAGGHTLRRGEGRRLCELEG